MSFLVNTGGRISALPEETTRIVFDRKRRVVRTIDSPLGPISEVTDAGVNRSVFIIMEKVDGRERQLPGSSGSLSFRRKDTRRTIRRPTPEAVAELSRFDQYIVAAQEQLRTMRQERARFLVEAFKAGEMVTALELNEAAEKDLEARSAKEQDAQ